MNVFGEPLEVCERRPGASTDETGKCAADPIHRICVRDIRALRPGFSAQTGQGDWSARRPRGANHCVCAGAYANYVSFTNVRRSPPRINCAATSEHAVRTWNRWNDRTRRNQGQAARQALWSTCKQQAKNKKQKMYLRNLLW